MPSSSGSRQTADERYAAKIAKSAPIKGLRCPDCDSSDVWRVGRRKGLLAMFMRLRGLSPYQCRKCRKIMYPENQPR